MPFLSSLDRSKGWDVEFQYESFRVFNVLMGQDVICLQEAICIFGGNITWQTFSQPSSFCWTNYYSCYISSYGRKTPCSGMTCAPQVFRANTCRERERILYFIAEILTSVHLDQEGKVYQQIDCRQETLNYLNGERNLQFYFSKDLLSPLQDCLHCNQDVCNLPQGQVYRSQFLSNSFGEQLQ